MKLGTDANVSHSAVTNHPSRRLNIAIIQANSLICDFKYAVHGEEHIISILSGTLEPG